MRSYFGLHPCPLQAKGDAGRNQPDSDIVSCDLADGRRGRHLDDR